MHESVIGPNLAPRPRAPETLIVLMHAHQRVLDDLLALACDFYACDFRPLVLTPDGDVQRLGPDPVPANLRAMIADACTALARVRHEFAAARVYDDG